MRGWQLRAVQVTALLLGLFLCGYIVGACLREAWTLSGL